MAATPPDDVAAMFDLPPPAPASTTAAADALRAAEAELAAELELTIESGGVAADAPDSRTDLRVPVDWPARLRLADGHVIELKVRNVSENGVGLASDQQIPARTRVDFQMDVPPLAAGGQATQVQGAIMTTYAVIHGAEIRCGGIWQGAPAGLDLVARWIRAR